MLDLCLVIALYCYRVGVPRWSAAMSQLAGEAPKMSTRIGFYQTWAGCVLTGTVGLGLGPLAALLVTVVWMIQWIDVRTHMIPDRLQLTGAGIAFTMNLREASLWQWHILLSLLVCITLVLIGWLYERWTGREAMGLGDVKYLGWLIWLGGEAMVVYCTMSAVCYLVCLASFNRMGWREVTPFAPVLSGGAILYLLGTSLGF